MGCECSTHAEMINAYTVLVGMRWGGDRPFGRPTRKWEDNTEIDLRETDGWCEMDLFRSCTNLWRTFVNTAMNFRVPVKGRNFLTF